MDHLIPDLSIESDDLDAFIESIAKKVVARRMAIPAIVMLESFKPLTFVGSQAMVFFNPMISIFGGINGYAKFEKILEDRDNVEKLITTIEKFEEEKNSVKGEQDAKRGH